MALIRSLPLSLVGQGRVNAVAPGPIWTPLIPSSYSAEEVATFVAEIMPRQAKGPKAVAPQCFPKK